MKVIGLLGNAGAGKDTIAEMIAPMHYVMLDGQWADVRALAPPPTPREAARPRAIQIALADPLKEYAREVYDFSVTQLWGPSSARNKPDERYPRTGEDGKTTYLSPREALQQLGTEWGRRMWADTWIMHGLRRARTFLTTQRIANPMDAATFRPNFVIERRDLVVISDIRFVNEVKALRAAGAEVWKVVRPELDTSSAMYSHVSEAEQRAQAATLDALATQTIINDRTISDLQTDVIRALEKAGF